MNRLAPPFPPVTADGQGDGPSRYRRPMTQVAATLVTLLVTAYICSFGAIPAIIALSLAKHILVAVLMMGLGTYGRHGG